MEKWTGGFSISLPKALLTGLVLCDSRSERVDIHVRASLSGGALHISGQDLGPSVEEFWGDLDYEYFYDLTPDDTIRLLTVTDWMTRKRQCQTISVEKAAASRYNEMITDL